MKMGIYIQTPTTVKLLCLVIASVGKLADFLRTPLPTTSAVKVSKRDFNYTLMMLQGQEVCEGTVKLWVWQDNFLTQLHEVWLFSGYSLIKLSLKSEPPDCLFWCFH